MAKEVLSARVRANRANAKIAADKKKRQAADRELQGIKAEAKEMKKEISKLPDIVEQKAENAAAEYFEKQVAKSKSKALKAGLDAIYKKAGGDKRLVSLAKGDPKIFMRLVDMRVEIEKAEAAKAPPPQGPGITVNFIGLNPDEPKTTITVTATPVKEICHEENTAQAEP